MTDEIFDPLPGDGYPDGPVDSEGEPLRGGEDGRGSAPAPAGAPSLPQAADVGPPAPGEGDDLLTEFDTMKDVC